MTDIETIKQNRQEALAIKNKIRSTNIDISNQTQTEWASLLQNKQKDMNKPQEMVKQKRIFHKDIYHRNNQYNPITQVYKDIAKETKQNSADNQYMAIDRQTGFEKALAKECQQNPVNFLSKRDQTVNMARIERPKECDLKSQMSGQPFNIVNQIPNKGKEEECKKIDEHNVVIPETKIVREYDIVSNNQQQDHENRYRQELDQLKHSKLSELEKQRKVNLITQKQQDEQKDIENLKQDKQKKLAKQARKEAAWPKEYLQSEGFVYDIVNPKRILDDVRREKQDTHFDRKKRYKLKFELEEVQHQKDFQKQDLEEVRKVNRISQNRQIEELEKGQDIVGQREFTDQDKWTMLEANKLRTCQNISDQQRKDREPIQNPQANKTSQSAKNLRTEPDHPANNEDPQPIADQSEPQVLKTEAFGDEVEMVALPSQKPDSIDNLMLDDPRNRAYSKSMREIPSSFKPKKGISLPERVENNELKRMYESRLKRDHKPKEQHLKSDHVNVEPKQERDVDFQKELYSESVPEFKKKNDKQVKDLPKLRGKPRDDKNFNNNVDTQFNMFGCKTNLDQREFRNEIFLNLNILTRPAGNNASQNATKKSTSRLKDVKNLTPKRN